jgi:hypothetical protein
MRASANVTPDSVSQGVIDLLLNGEAQTADEAEALYLDRHLADVVALVRAPLSEAEFRRHPLIALLLSHGSRGWEDSLQ